MGNHEVKSKFVRNLIRGRRFSDRRQRKYIEDLILLERFIASGIHGMWAGQVYNTLKTKYRKEWEAVYKELKPKEFVKELARERQEERWRKSEAAKEKKKEGKEREAWKRHWLRFGGKA